MTANSTTTYGVRGMPVTPDPVFANATVFTLFAFASDNLGTIESLQVTSSADPFLVQCALTLFCMRCPDVFCR